MKATYIDHMGDDLRVVNAARVSFNKLSKTITEHLCENCMQSKLTQTCQWCDAKTMTIERDTISEGDIRLLNFLARHNHFTPFCHPQITLHIKVPIFVARQLDKHQIGLVKNEVSRRYVSSEPEFYFPEEWRKQADDKKQGSGDILRPVANKITHMAAEDVTTHSNGIYQKMLDSGVCEEQARMILPQNMFTEYYWTGSLYAFIRMFELRLKADAQKETREIVQQIYHIIQPYFPRSIEANRTQEWMLID